MTSTTGRAVLGDGTILAFDWVYPDAEAYAWTIDDEHHPRGRTPMQQWIERAGEAGHDRAWGEVELVPLAVFRRFQHVGPFLYLRATPGPPEEMGSVIAAIGGLLERYGAPVRFWEEWCEPRIRDVCARFAEMGDDVPLADVADLHEYALHQTFTSVLALFGTLMPLRFTLDAVGLDGLVLAQQASQGGVNVSQQIDAEVFALARQAAADPRVLEVAAAYTAIEALARMRTQPTAAPFLDAFERFVGAHAARSEGWDLHAPTWGERPDLVFALVRAHLVGSAMDPDELARRSEAAKVAAIGTALAVLPADQHDRFLAMVAAVEGHVGVREGRAYWQMVLTGQTRLLLLRRGERLVAAGRIERPDDILWLEPPDFEEATGDLHERVAARRAEWDRITALAAPHQIGAVSVEFAPPAAVSDTELRGFPVSAGRVTGPARVRGGASHTS